jgi:LDH2 family malate/lactate/ureidoglycolate dehydrogenase
VTEILLPGELEARTTHQRRREGIAIPDETWSQIKATAEQVGLKGDLAP